MTKSGVAKKSSVAARLWQFVRGAVSPFGDLRCVFLFERSLVEPVTAVPNRLNATIRLAGEDNLGTICGFYKNDPWLWLGSHPGDKAAEQLYRDRLLRGERCYLALVGDELAHVNWTCYRWGDALPGRPLWLGAGEVYPPEPVAAPPPAPLNHIARLWRGLRRGYWLRLTAALLTDDLFAKPSVRAVARALVAINPPVPETWKMVVSTITLLRLFRRLHLTWLEQLQPTRHPVPVLLFRSDEPRPPEVPEDLGWSSRAFQIEIARVAGNHSQMFEARDADRMAAEFVSAVLQTDRSS